MARDHGWQAETGCKGDTVATWGFRSQALLCIKARCPGRKEQTRSSAVPSLSPECCDSDPSLFCSADTVTWPQQRSWAKRFTLTRVLHGILHTKRSQCCVSGVGGCVCLSSCAFSSVLTFDTDIILPIV